MLVVLSDYSFGDSQQTHKHSSSLSLALFLDDFPHSVEWLTAPKFTSLVDVFPQLHTQQETARSSLRCARPSSSSPQGRILDLFPRKTCSTHSLPLLRWLYFCSFSYLVQKPWSSLLLSFSHSMSYPSRNHIGSTLKNYPESKPSSPPPLPPATCELSVFLVWVMAVLLLPASPRRASLSSIRAPLPSVGNAVSGVILLRPGSSQLSAQTLAVAPRATEQKPEALLSPEGMWPSYPCLLYLPDS